MTNGQPACASARHRTLRVGGLALHALEWGEAGRPGLCFLHGGAAHAHWFDRVVPAFVDRFHVVSLDQRGHGESAWASPPAYATEDFAGDLREVLDALGWPRAVLAGHSMGGHNALAFAAWHPDRVAGLVVLDSRPAIPPERLRAMRDRGARPMRRHPSPEAAVAAFRLLPRETLADPALLAHMGEAGVAERDGGWGYRFDPETYGERQPADMWTLLDRIIAPTLIVRGGRSPILTPDMAARLVAGIKGATLAEIPESYHHVTLDAPAAVARALDTFLRARST
ncbi:MAG: alpha/beta hydrolase [Candidatus Rokubacteria bacterium]|nr:alpha/beta hydrolase [Candidatus Rokubacteria bacterium]